MILFAAKTVTTNVPWLWPAVISSASGLLGVLAGGAATAKLDSNRRRDEDRRQQQNESRLARASARLEQQRLLEFRANLATAVERKEWPPSAVRMPAPLPIEDRRILAQYLTGVEFLRVIDSNNDILTLSLLKELSTKAPVSDDDLAMLRVMLQDTDNAYDSLRRLAEDA